MKPCFRGAPPCLQPSSPLVRTVDHPSTLIIQNSYHASLSSFSSLQNKKKRRQSHAQKCLFHYLPLPSPLASVSNSPKPGLNMGRPKHYQYHSSTFEICCMTTKTNNLDPNLFSYWGPAASFAPAAHPHRSQAQTSVSWGYELRSRFLAIQNGGW